MHFLELDSGMYITVFALSMLKIVIDCSVRRVSWSGHNDFGTHHAESLPSAKSSCKIEYAEQSEICRDTAISLIVILPSSSLVC